MADSERDAKLVLRAEDRATKTFKEVAASVGVLGKTLKAQAKAAADGTGSLDDLKKTLKEIEGAADSLNKQKSALIAFEKAGAAAEAAGARVDKAADAYVAYAAKLADSEKVTDAQAGKLERLKDKVDQLSETFNKSNVRLDGTKERLASLGLSANDTDKQITAIVGTFRELTPLFAQASGAIDGYAANLVKATQDAKELAAVQKAVGAAQKAGVAPADIASARAQGDAIERLASLTALQEQRTKALADAERERSVVLAKTARETESNNKAQVAAALSLQQQREAAIAEAIAFREVAASSDAAAANLGRFGVTTTSATASLTRLADAVRGIVTPTLAEVQTLDGALKTIDQSASLASTKQKKRVSEYQDSLNQLAQAQAQAALVRQAQAVDAFKAQSRAVDLLEADLASAATKVRGFAAELAKVPPNADQVERQLREADAELEKFGTQAVTARSKLEALRESLTRAGVDADNLAEAEARIVAGAGRAASASEGLTKAVGGGAGGKGFLGLKAYELQNLSFQVNDVITSLASGIPVQQTIAQQGGQILQIFPQVISGFIRFLPILLPVAAGLGAVAYQLLQVKKASDAVKGFDALFTLSGNAAGLSATQFGAAQIALEKLGATTVQAKSALRTFIKEGLDPAGLNAFIQTASTIVKVTGEDLPAAADKLAAAYSGGYKQVAELNDLLGGPLNDAQLQAIQNDFDAGRATDARTLAQTGFTEAAQRTADKQKTEWKTAVDNLKLSFDNLGKSIDLSGGASKIAGVLYRNFIEDINAVTFALDIASNAVATYSRYLSKASAAADTKFGLVGDYQKTLETNYSFYGLDKNGQPLKVAPPPKPKPGKASGTTRTTGGQALLRQQQTELKNAKELSAVDRLRTAEQDARNKAAEAGASDIAEKGKLSEVAQAGLNARKIEQGKIDKENESAAKRGQSAADKAAREAESRQSKINALTLDLKNTYLSFENVKGADPFKAIQDKAEQAVNTIRDKFAKLAKLGVTTVDGKGLADYEQIIAKNAAIQIQLATQKKQEDDINALLDQRRQRLAAIEDARQRKEITAPQAVDQSQAVVDDLAPKIAALAEDAIRFNTAIRTTTYDPKLEAFIAKLQGDLQNASGKNAIKDTLDAALKDAQGNLEAIVKTRDEYVRVQNALVTAGLKTSADAQKSIQTEYDLTRQKILDNADAVQAVIDKMVQLGLLGPDAAAALTGSLQITRVETQKLDADIVAINNAIEGAISAGLTDFFDGIGASIAGVLEGTNTLGDALKGIGNAVLGFLASFASAIAKAILQLVALKIAKAAVAAIGLHSGGIVGRDSTFRRKVSADVFAGAVRYHSGGLAGLKPDEVPAILQKGEEVVTRDDPRNRLNGGATPAAAPGAVKIVNLFNAGEAVSAGADTAAGERAIINVIQRNPNVIRGITGR